MNIDVLALLATLALLAMLVRVELRRPKPTNRQYTWLGTLFVVWVVAMFISLWR